MQTYLMTRGLGRDYNFLGSLPAELWWREFGQLTAFEQPTLLVHSDNTGWQVYASAIPTTRRDRVNTLIRLSLALAGDHPRSAAGPSDGAVPDELVSVLALIRSWLDGPSASASEQLATLLDGQFPVGDTERFISTAGPDNDDEVNRRVECVLNQLRDDASRSADGVDPAPGPSDSWFGDVALPEVRAAFFHRTRLLLLGDDCGWAVQLNLAGAAEIRSHFERQHEPLVALLDERVEGGLSELAPKTVTPARARSPAASWTRVAAPARARSAVRSRTRAVAPGRARSPVASRTRAAPIAALLLTGLIGLIVWLLTHSQPPQPSSPGPPQPQPPQLTLPGPSTSRFP